MGSAPLSGVIAKDTYVEVSASPLYDSSGRITRVLGLTRDVTESKELEKRILEANRYLLALNDIASTLSQVVEPGGRGNPGRLGTG